MSRDVGVGQLVQQLEQRGGRLPFEIGAFVALEACEGLLQESVRLRADDVRVTPDGSVVVSGSAERAEPDEAARSLVSVLAQLLVAAGPGVPPYLMELVEESKIGQSPRDLRNLHDAIEASLIPINRGASRRVLARLVRESDRPPAPVSQREIDPNELDAELDELLRDPVSRTLEPAQAKLPLRAEPDEAQEPITERIRIPGTATWGTDPRPKPRTGSAAIETQAWEPARQPITATIRKWQPRQRDSEPEPASTPAAAQARVPTSASGSVPVSVPAPVSALESAPAPVSAPVPPPEPEPEPVSGPASASESVAGLQTAAPPEPAYDRPSLPDPRLPRRRGGWGVWLLAASLGLGAYALATTPALRSVFNPAAPEPVPGGVIDVTVMPADAQIFVFVGRGPAVATGLSVDGAHEFVIFDRGLRPSRGIVAKGATWTATEHGLLYELAVQAHPAASFTDALDLGSPETVPSAAGQGQLGTIRIITNPQGAKVYRFVGVGPTAQIPAASIQEGQEILVYHPEHETRRAVIGPSDWQARDGKGAYGASLEVQLPPLPGSVLLETPEH